MQQVHRLKIAPLANVQVNQRATYVFFQRIDGATNADTLRIKVDGQDLGLFTPGDFFRVPKPGTLWEFFNPGNGQLAGGNTGSFVSGANARYVIKLGLGSADSMAADGTVTVAPAGARRAVQGGLLNVVGEGTSAGGKFPFVCAGNSLPISVTKLTVASSIAQKIGAWAIKAPASNSGTAFSGATTLAAAIDKSAAGAEVLFGGGNAPWPSWFVQLANVSSPIMPNAGEVEWVTHTGGSSHNRPYLVARIPANTPCVFEFPDGLTMDSVNGQVAANAIGVAGFAANSDLCVTFEGELLR